MLTPALCRAARALIGIDRAELAETAGVDDRTVEAFEAELAVPEGNVLLVIAAALASFGVNFLEPGETAAEWAVTFRP